MLSKAQCIEKKETKKGTWKVNEEKGYEGSRGRVKCDVM